MTRLARRWRAARTLARIAPLYAALGLLKHVVPVSRLARWAWRPARSGAATADAGAIVARVLQAGRWIGAPDRDCLQRSLLVYRELSRLGLDPTLVVGFRRVADRLDGHAWVIAGGGSVIESAADLAAFTPALSFGAEGRAITPVAGTRRHDLVPG
jgi:hypothetical protein